MNFNQIHRFLGLILLLLLGQCAIGQALVGTYTIGGSAANYSTIDSAIIDLELKGVSGHVFFKIRQGVYQENISMDSIPGADTNKTVTFLPDSGYKSGVIIQDSSLPASNYTWQFNGVKYVTIKHLNIKSINHIYHVCINFQGSNEYIQIDSCKIEAPRNSYHLYGVIKQQSSIGFSDNISITNCHVINGGNSIRAYGGTSTLKKQYNWTITGNRLEGWTTTGILISSYSENVLIENNYLITDSLNNLISPRGIAVATSNNCKVLSNTVIINDTLSSVGIFVNDCDPIGGFHQVVANNMVSILGKKTTSNYTGIYTRNSDSIDVIYNSVFIASGISYGIRANGGYGVKYRNNAVINNGTGWVQHYVGSIKHGGNCLFGKKSTLSNVLLDSTSKILNPEFLSDTNLHSKSIHLYRAGIPNALIKRDIDGDVRDTLRPAIGADEVFLPVNDARLIGNDSILICNGANALSLKLKNTGSSVLSSVQIHWMISENGGSFVLQRPDTLSLSLASERDTTVFLRPHNFKWSSRYRIKAWPMMPNGTIDSFPVFDTASKSLSVSLSGSYTVGGNQPDFNSLNQADSAMDKLGICGPVVFKLRQGVYYQQIKLDSVYGNDSINTITFVPDSGKKNGVTIQFDASSIYNNYVFEFAGLNYVRFKHLNFKALDIEYAQILLFSEEANDVEVDSCVFSAPVSTRRRYNATLISKPRKSWGNVDIHNIKITNNYFLGGEIGIGISGGRNGSNIKVNNNQFENFRVIGVSIGSIESLEVSKNSIFPLDSVHSSGSGGIGVYSCSRFSINSNRIILGIKSSIERKEGIVISNCSGSLAKYNIVYNNEIVDTNSRRHQGRFYGVSTTFTDSCTIVHNSILNHTGSGSCLKLVRSKGIVVENNLLVNDKNGYAFEIDQSTYNDENNVVYCKEDSVSNAVLDTTTLNFRPWFHSHTSLKSNDLRINGKAKKLASVSFDKEGKVRHLSNPDIGAFEFEPIANDVAIRKIADSIICQSSDSIRVVIVNNGLDTLKSFRIDWNVTSDTGGTKAQTTYFFSGALASGHDTILSIGNYPTRTVDSVIIKAWTSLPNGYQDSVVVNDTVDRQMDFFLSGVYTIGGLNSDFKTVGDISRKLKNIGICGPVTLNISPGIYYEQFYIYSVPGNGINNPIIVQKDPNKLGEAIIRDSLNARYSSPFLISNVSNVTVQRITMENFNENGDVLVISSTSRVNILNNIIRGYKTLDNNSTCITIDAPSDTNRDLTIDSNVILSANYSILFYAKVSGKLIITNNYIDSVNERAFAIFGAADSLIVSRNRIQSHSTEIINGIAVNGIKYAVFDGNYMNLTLKVHRGNGFVLLGKLNWPSNVSVTNNFVHTKEGQGNGFGSMKKLKVLHNTFISESVVIQYPTLAFNQDTGGIFINNIVLNKTGGETVHFYQNQNLKSDYNNYIGVGAALFEYNQLKYTNLSNWQSFSKQDSNSVTLNPIFRNNSPIPTNLALDNKGKPVQGVEFDYLHAKRDSLKPDIGCAEFDTTINDLQIESVLEYSICPGVSPVVASLRNTGGNSISSFKITWSIHSNGTRILQSGFKWVTGNLSPSKDSIFQLGTFNFLLGQKYYITAKIDSVNGGLDGYTANDSATSPITSPRMNGNYTVGGVSPDFVNLKAALDTLNQRGVCGPVVLSLRSGTFDSTHVLKSIYGTSKAHTITIQTDTGSTSQAIITNSQGPSITLSGAQYFIVKNVNIISKYRGLVAFEGINENNRFTKNKLDGYQWSNTSYVSSNFYSLDQYAVNRDLLVDSNTISKGSYGFYFFHNFMSKSRNVEIIGNQISEYTKGAIYLNNSDSTLIQGNNIKAAQPNKGGSAISMYAGYVFSILENKILHSQNRIIEVKRNFGVASKKSRIANNFLSSNQLPGAVNGIAITGGSEHIEIHYNSILLKTAAATNSCVFSDRTKNLNLSNNILKNEALGYTQHYVVNLPVTSNYNDLITNGSNIGYYNGTRSSINLWRNATGKDANSVIIDPKFISSSDLHIQNVALDSKGSYSTKYLKDIDGELRDPNGPDIGADEFFIFKLDAGVSDIQLSGICHGSQTIYGKIKNHGSLDFTNVITSLYVSVNSAPFVKQSSNKNFIKLKNAKDTLIGLGVLNFQPGNTYSLMVVVDSVNGVLDTNDINDSATTKSMQPMWSGIYQVGGTSPYWSTIDSAVSALEKYGVCDSVTLYVNSGNYNEKVTINHIPGASKNNWVTILGDTSGSIPDWYYAGIPLHYSGAHHFSVRNMKIRTTSTNKNAIVFDSTNVYLTLIDNWIEGPKIDSIHPKYSTINSVGRTGSIGILRNQIQIVNNTIRYGSIGMYSVNVSSRTWDSTIYIGRNNFEEFYSYALHLTNISNLEVISNSILSNNKNLGASGIRLHNIRYATLDKNNIVIRNGQYGFYLTGFRGENNLTRCTISNNMVAVGAPRNTGCTALRTSGIWYTNVFHNSFHVEEPTNHVSSTVLDLFGDNRSYFYNNIISHGGKGFNVHYDKFSADRFNYNIYNNDSAIRVRVANVYYDSLAAWKNAGFDTVSIKTNPSFKDTFDLHITSPIFRNFGRPLNILNDLDGDKRNLVSPTPGADEYSPYKKDGELKDISAYASCTGQSPVGVKVLNQGADTITSLKLSWQIKTNSGSFISQTPFYWTGKLAPNKDTLVVIGLYPFVGNTTYFTKVWVDSINGGIDNYRLNDTLAQQMNVDSLPSVFFPKINAVCVNSKPIRLNTGYGIPAGGKGYYFGKGTDSLYFYPDSIGVGGNATIGYVYVDTSGCRDTVLQSIAVDTVPVVSFSFLDSICSNSDPVNIFGGLPAGGIYKGQNVSQSAYKPSFSGIDSLSYVFVDKNNCSDSVIFHIRVDTIPKVSISPWPVLCENEATFIPYGGTPTGGSYFGKGVQGGKYNAILVSPIQDRIYYRIQNGRGCSDTVSAVVNFKLKPVVKLAAFSPVCEFDGPVFIGSGGSPAGGTYSSVFSINDTFNTLTSGAGDFSIYYAFTDTNSCSDSTSINLKVEENPKFSLGNDTTVCTQVGKIDLDPSLSRVTYLWNTGANTKTLSVTKSGTYWLKATNYWTSANCFNTDTIKITIGGPCVGVESIKKKQLSIKCSPNPSHGKFQLLVQGLVVERAELIITDVNGQIVHISNLEVNNQDISLPVNVDRLSNGVYLVSIQSEGQQLRKRILINR